jgi:hypothetical protein
MITNVTAVWKNGSDADWGTGKCFRSLPHAYEALAIRKRKSEEMKRRARFEEKSPIRKRNLVALPKSLIYGKKVTW